MARLARASVLVVAAAVLLLAGARILAASASEGGTLNVVTAAGLRETKSIAIDERANDGSYKSATIITDIGVVTKIVATLDIPPPLRRRVQCLERYRLRFTLRDGSTQTFGYSCDASGNFLRGTQAFWQFQDVSPPLDFVNLIAERNGGGRK